MKINKGLGKGLSILFAQTADEYGSNLEEAIKTGAPLDIDISKVYGNPNQPRKSFNQEALEELGSSIKKHGVIQPIIVTKVDDKFMIIAGERRFRASKLIGNETIPAIIKDYTELQIKEISLIENLQREDLNCIESALAMKQLIEEFNLTQEELSEKIGKNRSTIANFLRLLTLTPAVIKMLANNELSQGHARALITLTEAEQEKVAQMAISEGWSVRQVEVAVKEINNKETVIVKKDKKIKEEHTAELKDLVVRMQRGFGTKVGIVGNQNKGRIYIDYYTRDDLDRLSDILESIESKSK